MANLYGANLYGANLTGANLTRANLTRAILSWSSHSIIAEILKGAADGDILKLKVAGLILLMRDWCWEEFSSLDEPKEIKDWAFSTLSGWAWADDNYVPMQLIAWMVQNNAVRPIRDSMDNKEKD